MDLRPGQSARQGEGAGGLVALGIKSIGDDRPVGIGLRNHPVAGVVFDGGDAAGGGLRN